MNILTFDVEEWFHILDFEGTKDEKQWHDFEYRLDANMDALLELLDRHSQKATFFCLGWLTQKHKHIIKRIDALGYEVATHSHLHNLVYEQHAERFKEDLSYSIQALEDVTGKKIRAYRAPGFSLKEENRWVFEILLACGIEVDCSIFPAKRAHGGFENFGVDEPSLIETNHGMLKEFPMSIDQILWKKIVSSGGGYFRLFPYPLIRHLMRKRTYAMTYFHPHDFDPHRPVIDGLAPFQKFKAHVGLGGAMAKLEKLITDFEFIDLDEAIERVAWEKAPVIHLPERRSVQRI